MAERGKADSQVFSDYVSGDPHLEFFRRELLPIAKELGAGTVALEAGAGMCWHSAMLAAYSSAKVVATELDWGEKTPLKIENVHALYRLAERDSQLHRLIDFNKSSNGHLESMVIDPRVSLTRASAHNLPLGDSTADLVYSVNCLEHIPDLTSYIRESHRVLRTGGILYNATEPLFYSPFGHHLQEIFPLPWGHLLWCEEEFTQLVIDEIGEGREWEPGVPLASAHLRQVQSELNRASPEDIRKALRACPWHIEAWLDLLTKQNSILAKEVGIYSAIDVPREWLLLMGLRFRLRKVESKSWYQPTLSHRSTTRQNIRRVKNIFEIVDFIFPT